MNDASHARESIWRFSLRELLLLVLAAGAFMGWGTLLYQRSQKFEATPFYYNDETWQYEIVKVIGKEIEDTEFNPAVVAGMQRHRATSVSRTIFFRVTLPPAKRTLFLDALEERVTEKLANRGCQLGAGNFGSGDKKLRAVIYYRGLVEGSFEVWMRDVGHGDAVVIIEIHEGWRRIP